ncbi:proton extrusion protein PcxA [Aliterella atlantica]|uniref:Proton extrusion protein PxcA n=1 Tax=Aliterella atlantica CENA595 TaxID=1618023 RepID=A0A0D8ZV16_9CYAN|nr:proton extrusion protein PcxA [Aliterella atlantica]KJH72294.1 proton extrusion protein PcxA [Aliterella atlantica CENA595]
MKKPSWFQNVYSYLLSAQQWYMHTPERSLDEAYQAALMIQAIEQEYFDGQKIPYQSQRYGSSVMNYLNSELNKFLKTVRMRLTEFNISRSWFNNSNSTSLITAKTNGAVIIKDARTSQARHYSQEVLEKLTFIDKVVGKYVDRASEPTNLPTPASSSLVTLEKVDTDDNPQNLSAPRLVKKQESKAEETSILPRSILSTLNRLKIELDPKSEEEVVQKFRSSQVRTITSIRLILLFIIVPFLTFQLSKNLLISPIIDRWRNTDQANIFLNYEMEERALQEMQKFEERLKFNQFLNGFPQLSPEALEAQTKEEVNKIAQQFRRESTNAVKNVFADLCALIAFSWLIVTSKREIAILKDFIDQVVYGLSDSAKAFIIILFTDIFVGFHSPHGWEVILSGISRHLGLPENHSFIFLFIATFPVILDTIFKYWIFRYLNRISPSAVATYRNMNE